MNIDRRLRELETVLASQQVDSTPRPCDDGDHPKDMFHLYRDYPPTGYRSPELITKGHCDLCGFDDYMFAFLNLTKEQEDRRWDLRYGGDGYYKEREYLLRLIDAGLTDLVPFPPSIEAQLQYTTRVREK